MKTITRYIDVYEYSELDDNAKEHAKRDYLDTCREPFIFTNLCEENLAYLLPNSDLKVEYSLASCQGDGFNIYGTVCLDDLLNKLSDKFTDKELRFLRWAFRNYSTMYKMPCNNSGYCYCVCDLHDYTEDIIYELEWHSYRGIQYDVLEKFNKLAKEYMTELCSGFEKDGYDYFYEVSDDEMVEISDANEWYYTSDGSYCYV